MSHDKRLLWPEQVAHLPRTLDRFRATAVFFDLQYPTFLRASLDARKWTSWAALSALASIPEIVAYEFEAAGLLHAWKSSDQFREIRSDRTFAVAKELRNLEVHIAFQGRVAHFDIQDLDPQEPVNHDSYFFAPISWREFQKLNNVRSGRSIVDEDAVEEFNQIARRYSVRTIVEQLLERMAVRIYDFSVQYHLVQPT